MGHNLHKSPWGFGGGGGGGLLTSYRPMRLCCWMESCFLDQVDYHDVVFSIETETDYCKLRSWKLGSKLATEYRL